MAEPSDQKKLPRSYAKKVPSPGHSRVADVVRTLAAPVADTLGYILWDVAYVKEGADYILRITIDSPDGISVDDCENMSRALDPVLDEADPIEQAYLLEVSSPGIERELTRDEHFAACTGEKVEVRLFAPVDGGKSYIGVLEGLDAAGQILLDVAGVRHAFPRAAVSRAGTVYDFGRVTDV